MATSQSNTTPKSRTDVIFQRIDVYVEGVQINFNSLSISTSIGELPTAILSVPPQTGIFEITRFYNPKIHVFFTDQIDGDSKLLFSGIILGSNYSKSTDGSGSTQISFQCVHRFQNFKELNADYSGWMNEIGNPHPNESTVQSAAVSSKYALALALVGCYQDAADTKGKREVSEENVGLDKANNTDTSSPIVLPASLADYGTRLMGMPGVLINYWNQFKKYAYSDPKENEMMIKLYIPMVEDGLQFFKRLAGHYLIESRIEAGRIDPCPDKTSSDAANKPRIVPPALRLFMKAAVQTELSLEVAQSVLQFSGEIQSIYDIFQKFLHSMEYEMLTLSSPAEVPLDPSQDLNGNFTPSTNPVKTYGIETVIKPQMPFYFSPICNVIYPTMLSSINVSQDDYSIPTRITLKNVDLPGTEGGIGTYFRTPPSIREAIARYAGVDTKNVDIALEGVAALNEAAIVGVPNVSSDPITGATSVPTATRATGVPNMDLAGTTASSHNVVGAFEQGRGVKHIRAFMPNWLKYYAVSQKANKGGADGWPDKDSDPDNWEALQAMSRGWVKRYGTKYANLNPWSISSGLQHYQRMLVAHADYEYTMAFSRARTGQAEIVFNPYIVPGYPIDILDGTPNHPNFHAYCTSVTHSITATSINTSVGFVSAMTYAELDNYFIMPVHPWLQYNLSLAETQTILNNTAARDVAGDYYMSVLGVRAVAPSDLFDFSKGRLSAVKRMPGGGLEPGSTDRLQGANGGELNPMYSATGGLSMAYRNIEAKSKIEERWGIKFIDMRASNYNPVAIKYKNAAFPAQDLLEPGQSQWLDYDPLFT